MTRIVLLVVLACRVAYAETPVEEARKYDDEAKALFKAGSHREAAEKFDAAYALDPDLAYLVNAGRAHLEAKQCGEAVKRYRTFLKVAAKDLKEERETINKFLEQAEACAKKQAEEPEPTNPPIERGPEPPITPPRKPAYFPAYGVGAVGLLALTAGVLFTLDVGKAEDERRAICPTGCTWDQTKQDQVDALQARGDRSSIIAIVSYAAGGAAIIGAVALAVRAKGRVERDVAVAPLPGGGFAAARFRF